VGGGLLLLLLGVVIAGALFLVEVTHRGAAVGCGQIVSVTAMGAYMLA
tara:strand:+ start:43 stop:186 length:144 start_codon:yes stop_codon:yes gene_type:complete